MAGWFYAGCAFAVITDPVYSISDAIVSDTRYIMQQKARKLSYKQGV